MWAGSHSLDGSRGEFFLSRLLAVQGCNHISPSPACIVTVFSSLPTCPPHLSPLGSDQPLPGLRPHPDGEPNSPTAWPADRLQEGSLRRQPVQGSGREDPGSQPWGGQPEGVSVSSGLVTKRSQLSFPPNSGLSPQATTAQSLTVITKRVTSRIT